MNKKDVETKHDMPKEEAETLKESTVENQKNESVSCHDEKKDVTAKQQVANKPGVKHKDNDIIFDIVSDDDVSTEKIPLKQKLKAMFSLNDDVAPVEVIKDRIVSGGRVTGTNQIILVCAIIIACIGLNMSSIPVIIGAMLISPILGTITALAYGIVAADKKFVLSSIKGLLFQFLVSFSIATLFFLISPIKEPSTELIARTNPSVFDILISVFGGVAGIIAITRDKEYSNVIPGVAIATALMPPICTMGFSLANGEWNMLAGAAYLLLINVYFIFAAQTIVLEFMDVPKVKVRTKKEATKVKIRLAIMTLLVASPAITMAVLTALKITP